MALLGGLIHVFNIIETEKRKKFTVYKIQMISFPKNSEFFHCLTKQIVVKRYSEFRKLENELSKNYKCYNLKTFFKADTAFFKR
jgi:subtilase family serine protease